MMIDYRLDHLIPFINHYRLSHMPAIARAMLAIGSVLVYVIVGTSGFAAAILNFLLPVSASSLPDRNTEFLDPENIGIADGIYLLSCTEAEIRVLTVRPPPS